MYLLPIAYLAPIAYYHYLVNYPTQLEVCAHYMRQMRINRCKIATAHGIEELTIPVEHTDHTPVSEVIISHHHDWQSLHWRALEAAYNASPYFDYYKDELLPFYTQPADNLMDFNLKLQEVILNLLDLPANYTLTENYQREYTDKTDLRDMFNTSKNVVTLQPDCVSKKYYQIFEQKYGFVANLSIVDLLFNMGNESRLILLNK